MKIYWSIVLFFYFLWIMISHQYPSVSWWSIFSSNRSTHTPLMEHISYIKVTLTLLTFLGLSYLLHQKLQKHVQ